MDENFKKQIIVDFGLSGMAPESQEKMIERIGNMLFEAVIERSVDQMDEGVMKDFENLMTNVGQDYKQVISFLQTKVPGFKTIVSEELSHLKRSTSGIFA